MGREPGCCDKDAIALCGQLDGDPMMRASALNSAAQASSACGAIIVTIVKSCHHSTAQKPNPGPIGSHGKIKDTHKNVVLFIQSGLQGHFRSFTEDVPQAKGPE